MPRLWDEGQGEHLCLGATRTMFLLWLDSLGGEGRGLSALSEQGHTCQDLRPQAANQGPTCHRAESLLPAALLTQGLPDSYWQHLYYPRLGWGRGRRKKSQFYFLGRNEIAADSCP